MSNVKLNIRIFSDIHNFNDPDKSYLGVIPQRSLDKCIESAVISNKDLIVLLGDNSHDGSIDSYRRILECFSKYKCEKLIVAGNHDNLTNMNIVFGYTDWHKFNSKIIRANVNIIALNTVVNNEDYGFLNNEELGKLKEISRSKKELVIFMHHPPINIGSNIMDKLKITTGEVMLDILKSRSTNTHIFFGHVHCDYSFKIGKISLNSVVSTFRQFEKDKIGDYSPSLRGGWGNIFIQNGTLNNNSNKYIDL